MLIDPIHAGSVALAQSLVAASQKRPRVGPLRRLAEWWRGLDQVDELGPDPAQLMLWSDCGGRPYVSALNGFLVINHFRRRRASPATSQPG